MSTLICFGFSYTANAYIAAYGAQFDRIAGTVRSTEKADRLRRDGLGGCAVEPFLFHDPQAEVALASALADAALLIVSIPPDADGDPALRHYSAALQKAPRLRTVVYLSTIGVYGDHAGGWVDETTPANPISPRSQERLQAEQEWQAFGQRTGLPVAIFRLPGIYGPGRNALATLARGEARRIAKPGQVFNRIHVDDIAQAIDAAYARRAGGLFNICDDEPAPAQDLITYAAGLLGVEPPPEIPFDDIKDSMSPMARSFYAESKRARNTRMKQALGIRLAYPTYREGLRALHRR